MLDNLNDIIAKVAEDNKVSRNLVKFIIKDFETNLKKSIIRPTVAKIELQNFARFYLSANKCKEKLLRDSPKDVDLREIFKKLENERQTANGDHNAGCGEKSIS